MPLLLDVRSILRRHREERAGDLYALARRLAAAESIEPAVILETLEAAGADDDALADAVELVSRRDELRRVAAQGPAAQEELAGLRETIAKHKAELVAAEEKYRRAVSPLATSEEAAKARATAATQAESALLHPANLPSQINSRLEEARRELLAAEHAVTEIESLISRQERRVEDGLAVVEPEGGLDKCSRRYNSPESRQSMSFAVQEAVTNVRGGRHQISEAKARLPQAVAARDAAQAAWEAAQDNARNF